MSVEQSNAPPGSTAQPTSYRRVIERLTKIEIENYRGFPGRFQLELPEGCNLLIYGENGVGKSSLFNSVTDFFESPDRKLAIKDNRYRFGADPAAIRLTFSLTTSSGSDAAQRTYEWSVSKNEASSAEMRSVDKGKGCLEYRSLLRIHLLPTGRQDINLFDVFIDPLLAHYKNPASNPSHTFAEEWERIKSPFMPYVWKPARLDDWIRDFNAGLERVVKDTVKLASELLQGFDKELGIEIEFTPASYKWRPKALTPPRIIAKPVFRRLPHPDYYRFLNEARLSALAIAIYFSGLKASPAADLRLLVLDDVLIGLDMANRMVVLGVAEKLFPDWQMIILTYHRAWFEILKARTADGNWTHPWRAVTLTSRKAGGTEFPVIAEEAGSLIWQAKAHLEKGDLKAAAVYARSAWEAELSRYSANWRLLIPYAESRRQLDTDSFLRSISRHLETLRDGKTRERARAVMAEIRHARRFVLNPNAHYDPELEDQISAEIGVGIAAVEEFVLLLRSFQKKDFAAAISKPSESNVGEGIAAALDHFRANRREAALDALGRAFERHLDQLLRARGEFIRYGVTLNRESLLVLAGPHLCHGPTRFLLRHLRAYLLGRVASQQFDPLSTDIEF